MLDDDNGIAQVTKFLEDFQQAVGVALMESDTGLVKDIKATHKRGTQRGGQVDALTLATRQRVRHAVQREIAKPHIEHELQARSNLGEQATTNLLFLFGQLQVVEPLLQSDNGHLDKVRDAASTNLHIVGLRLQSRAVTLGARRLATIARQHDTILSAPT